MGRHKKIKEEVIVIEEEASLSFSASFSAEHKLPGDKKEHSHKYDVTVIIDYGVLNGNESDLAQDAFIIAINQMDKKYLNDLFENDVRHSFIAPKLDNIGRHISICILDTIAGDNPKRIEVNIAEHSSDGYTSSVKLVTNCKAI